MTSAAPDHRAAPQMTHIPDPTVTAQAPMAASTVEARPARPTLRGQIAENPLLSLFGGAMLALLTFLGTVVVALLVFTLTSTNSRIDSLGDSLGDRIDRLEDSVDRLEDKVDAGFAAQGAQIAELDRKLTALIAELDRKLTALIAVLNATEAVDAALEGRLLAPDEGTLEPEGEPPG